MSYFIISFKKAFAYRVETIFSILGSIIFIFTSIALWTYIYNNDEDMIHYMILYVIISNIISLFYSSSVSEKIGERVSSGMFAIDLVRPQNFLYINLTQTMGEITANFIKRGIPLLVFFSPVLAPQLKNMNFLYFFLGILSLMLGTLLFFSQYAIIGLMALVIIEIWPLKRIMDDTIRFFSGAFIPISIFPNILRVLAKFLPFYYLYAFPLELFLNGKDIGNITYKFVKLILWLIFYCILLAAEYRYVVKRCVVQGG